MNILKLMLLGFFMLSTPLVLSACEQEGPAEEAMENVGEDIDNATGN